MAENGYSTKDLLELLRKDFQHHSKDFRDFEKEMRNALARIDTTMNTTYVTKSHLEAEIDHLRERYDPVRTAMMYIVGLIVTAIIGALLMNIGL